MYKILLFINRILIKLGFEIRKTIKNPVGYFLHIIPKPNFPEISSGVYEIDIHKCGNQYYFSHAEDGWHPYSAVAEQYLQNPDLKYEDSVLKTYYEKFQPSTLQEALLDAKDPVAPLNELPRTAVRELWRLDGSVAEIKRYHPPEETQMFGPVSDKYGDIQLQRIIRTVQSVEKYGYVPDTFDDGYLKGYFILYKGDYRFIPTAGKHRAGVFKALGINKVKAVCYPNLKVLDYDKAESFAIVRSGLLSADLAQGLIERYFTHNGKERAQALKII